MKNNTMLIKQPLAIYAGTFDPPTNGHLWIIERAAALFGQLIIAIGVNPEKKTTYSLQERIGMLNSITANKSNVSVEYFEDMYLVDYAHKMGVKYLIRGVRSLADYEYERTICCVNSDIHPDITTLFLFPPRQYIEISSTLIKSLVGFDNWEEVVGKYVPVAVKDIMKEKMRIQK